MLRLINDFEITIKRLMSEELKNELKCLKESHGSAFIEGGIGKRGKLERNFGARFLIKNNAEGIFVLHKLIELSGGLYEAYARLFITDSDIPVIKCCNGARDHKVVYTVNENCPICGRKAKKCNTLNKESMQQLKDFKVSMSEL